MFFRQLLNDESACASYLLGCKSRGQLAVVDPHVDLVDQYIALAEAQDVPIAAVFETHVQADHVSALPDLVARTGAAYLPRAQASTSTTTRSQTPRSSMSATPSSRRSRPPDIQAHHAYLVTDHARADDPWMVLTGDALLVGDAGRPDLHAHGDHSVEEMARALSLTDRAPAEPARPPLGLPRPLRRLGLRPRSLRPPASTIGFERRHNQALQHDSEEAFVEALVRTSHPPRSARPRSSPRIAPGGRHQPRPRREHGPARQAHRRVWIATDIIWASLFVYALKRAKA